MTATDKARETARERGNTLFTVQGYTCEPYPDRPGVYSVQRGANDQRPLRRGESAWNDVDVIQQTCSCAFWAIHQKCKHLDGMNAKIAEAMALVAPMLPTEAAGRALVGGGVK